MHIHFISIGGSVMHQLAIALHKKGYTITGSDDEIFEPSRSNLAQHGLLPPEMGWHEAHITPALDAVILGMHARLNNPELLKAKQLGIKVYSFPEYMYQESLQKTRVAVGGSHGKTTTTAMMMHALRHGGMPFDYLVGARLEGFEQSVNITDAPVLVCEADEYPASAIEKRPKFHFLFPHIAIITGIAWDHINVFPTWENYLLQFEIFIGKIEPNGCLIYNDTDAVLVELVAKTHRTDLRYQPYGLPAFSISHGLTTVTLDGESGPFKVFGQHNLLNAHAAFLACRQLGLSARQFVDAMASFAGASKRLEVLASNNGSTIFRDFAHAPSKVTATMEAVKQQYPNRRLIAVLELHTYSSLNEAFMPQYAGALDAADAACVFYSPHAMAIKQMPDLPAQSVVAGFAKPGLVVATNRAHLEAWLQAQTLTNTNLLLMSSGNFEQLSLDWLKALLASSAADE
ncbi:MAG: peptidoglycan synthetase [Bacteroidetes bacterium]|nr:MAG: peptidoglycan synthetase [Bacteroidota bacterium]